jgi:hypothetical protein
MLSTWTEVLLPSPSMGEGKGGGEAWWRSPRQATPAPPHPNRSLPLRGGRAPSLTDARSLPLRGQRAPSLTGALPPPGGKEKDACTKIYVPVLRSQRAFIAYQGYYILHVERHASTPR